MRSNADNQRRIARRVRGGVSAFLAAAALSSIVGCSLDALPPAQSPRVAAADVDTCRRRIVEAIWRGENVGGPRCAGSAALAAEQTGDYGRRIQIVCERTHIRTILSGEAAPHFTQEACTTYAPKYEQATLRRACKEAARLRKSREEDLTPAQSAACETHLFGNGELRTTRNGSRKGIARPARRDIAFAAVPRNIVPVPDGAAPSAPPSSAPPSAVAPTAVAPSGAPPSAVAPSAPPNAVAPSSVDPRVAERAPEGDDGGFVLAACEDRYVESIWKGEDVTGGAACAGYVSADGAAPHYRFSRLQNVCEGAEIRSQRRTEALPAFTAQACQPIFAARRLPAEPAPELASVAAAGAAEPAQRPGLDEAAIASTVDANWRAIGRDCLSVAPRSGSVEAPAHTAATVTITVSASGRVRTASARAAGRRELEMCIESSVRGWVFPAAAGETKVGIPLVFAGE